MEYKTTNIKADKFTFPVVELLTTELESFFNEMDIRTSQAPAFFLNAPLVLDFTKLEGNSVTFLELVVDYLRTRGMNPLGVRGCPLTLAEKVDELKLAVLPEERKPRKPVARKDDSISIKTIPSEVPAVHNVFHTRTVRSGQKLTAMDGDLTVVASAGAGSELIAAGNIHVYGALRGRAIAGVGGDKSCRIFCQKLDAELVSIAGTYRLSDDIDDRFRRQPVQIFLEGEQLQVQLLSETP
jgi:septum site-determining protein MinC